MNAPPGSPHPMAAPADSPRVSCIAPILSTTGPDMRGKRPRARANPRGHRLFGPVFLAALLLSACVHNPEPTRPDGMEPGREGDRPHALTTTRLLTIGDHTDAMDFFRLGQIVLEEDGGMVVADAGTRSLYWFDSAGNVESIPKLVETGATPGLRRWLGRADRDG
jgi:hypothetical protein